MIDILDWFQKKALEIGTKVRALMIANEAYAEIESALREAEARGFKRGMERAADMLTTLAVSGHITVHQAREVQQILRALA